MFYIKGGIRVSDTIGTLEKGGYFLVNFLRLFQGKESRPLPICRNLDLLLIRLFHVACWACWAQHLWSSKDCNDHAENTPLKFFFFSEAKKN